MQLKHAFFRYIIIMARLLLFIIKEKEGMLNLVNVYLCIV